MEKTYKQTIDMLESIASRHQMVGSFVNDSPLAINDNVDAFPVVAAYPGISTMQKNTVNIRIKFIVMDLLLSDFSNEKDVLSDTLQIIKDFIDEINENDAYAGIYLNQDAITMEPFAENFKSTENTDVQDVVGGWYAELIFTINAPRNRCITPITE